MGNFITIESITLEEAVWLIKSTFNTAHDLGKPVDFNDITPESVAKNIHEYRAINASYELMKSKVLEETEH